MFTIIMTVIAFIKERNENGQCKTDNSRQLHQRSNPLTVLITCFSIKQNLNSLHHVNNSRNTIPIIDGLK